MTASLWGDKTAAQITTLIPSHLFLAALSLEVVQAPQGLADKPPADPPQSSEQIKTPVEVRGNWS